MLTTVAVFVHFLFYNQHSYMNFIPTEFDLLLKTEQEITVSQPSNI